MFEIDKPLTKDIKIGAPATGWFQDVLSYSGLAGLCPVAVTMFHGI